MTCENILFCRQDAEETIKPILFWILKNKATNSKLCIDQNQYNGFQEKNILSFRWFVLCFDVTDSLAPSITCYYNVVKYVNCTEKV